MICVLGGGGDLCKIRNRLGDTILKLILNGSSTHQGQVPFNLLIDLPNNID